MLDDVSALIYTPIMGRMMKFIATSTVLVKLLRTNLGDFTSKMRHCLVNMLGGDIKIVALIEISHFFLLSTTQIHYNITTSIIKFFIQNYIDLICNKRPKVVFSNQFIFISHELL